MPSEKQLAIVIPSLRGGFHLTEIERPSKPGPGKILLKVIAAGLNPADWKIHDYNVHIPGYPFVPGCDYAGIVEEVGDCNGVGEWKKGDRLYVFFATAYGGECNGSLGCIRPMEARSSNMPK